MTQTAELFREVPSTQRQLTVNAPTDDAFLTREEVAALTPEIVRDRVRALLPLIAKHAPEVERLGHPHPAVWKAIAQTGFFYHFVPKVYGGCEFGPEDFFETTGVIAQGCASTAWAASFTVEHNWIGALYPKEAQDIFFKDGKYISAPAVTQPRGSAVRVPGGYKVTAHWKYGSGVMNSDWIMGIATDEGDPDKRPLWLAFPTKDATVLESWLVDGLIGTGSNDIAVTDLFVPEYMAVDFLGIRSGVSPGGKIHPNPLYSMPAIAFLAIVVSSTVVGAARGAVEIYRERLKTRKVTGTNTVLCEKTNSQITLAKVDLMVRTAESQLKMLASETLRMAATGQAGDEAARCAVVANNVFASRLARDAARLVVDSSGSSVHFLKDPLQRILRDVNTGASHLIQDFETLAEQHGRFLLGYQPTSFFF